MRKDILKTAGIVAFFAFLGYVLTYPYEVELDNKDMVLMSDKEQYKKLEDIINAPNLKGKILYISSLNNILLHIKGLENKRIFHTEGYNKLYNKYEDVRFIYIYDNNNNMPFYSTFQSSRNEDYIREWKKVLKEVPIKGVHILAANELCNDMNKRNSVSKSVNYRNYYPYSIWVDKLGKIHETFEVPSVSKKHFWRKINKLDSLLKIQNNDTIISK